ncbi:ANTAR domain-containing protein [Kribbella capetownensis]|uniref:ANTAR domain-containing protein n=1 Tax=Kribbella capetownensis TaxID=1572659 RepID=A0A4R0JGV3_9ACTN|nr:GAF and ANTAR domain-containing protein [Kribbella capetownensis]TCC43818.1 ANTAR domain-containing protein [Kribbella capetownensis]
MQHDPADYSLAVEFAQLALSLHDAEHVDETIESVVRSAVQAVGGDAAGLVLSHRGGRLEIAAVTDPVVETIYRHQLETGEGALLAAAAAGSPLHVRDVTTDPRWPRWSEVLAGLGLRSVIHVPMVLGGRGAGILSVYAALPNAFSADDVAVTHILARHASVAVATARRQQNLAQAVDARKLVGQAMGILMERYGLDGDRAFEVLKRYSQDTHTKLRDVAQHLIQTRRLPTGPAKDEVPPSTA